MEQAAELTLITILVVICSGHATLWVRPIVRLLHYSLKPRPPQFGGKLARKELATAHRWCGRGKAC